MTAHLQSVGAGWRESRETRRKLRNTPSAHRGGIAGTVGRTEKCGCKDAKIFTVLVDH